MKVLYISPIFDTGSDPGSDRHYYFLKRLAARGHDVRVITSAVVYTSARVRPECRRRLWTNSEVDGVHVLYLWSYSGYRGNLFRRLLYMASFMALAAPASLLARRPDVVYVPNSPLFVGFVGCLIARLRHLPLVFEVADVWPDAGIAMGFLTNRYLIGIMKWAERFCYGQATAITAMTAGIKANVEAKCKPPGKKVVLVTNGVNPELFVGVQERDVESLRSSLGLDGRFVAMYFGAHGRYNSLWTIIEVAERFRKNGRVTFLLIGDGDEKRALEESVREKGLTNVRFLGPVPRAESPLYLALADAYLLPNRKGSFFRMNLPNKLFDFLMSGKPIVVAGEGESGDAVLAAAAGAVVQAEDSDAMAVALEGLEKLSPSERIAMGERGRAFVTRNYDREERLQTLERLLAESCGVAR